MMNCHGIIELFFIFGIDAFEDSKVVGRRRSKVGVGKYELKMCRTYIWHLAS